MATLIRRPVPRDLVWGPDPKGNNPSLVQVSITQDAKAGK